VIDEAGIPEDVRALCRRLREAGHEAFLVGGGIRDLLLGRAPKDFDVATSAHPDQVMHLFGSRFAIPTGLQHGTVTVLTGAPPTRPVEVTTYRAEGVYLDGRRPSSVSFGATLTEDLARRDFTMNAIAYDPIGGHVADPFGGQADLGRGLIRAVGDPIERFTEDGLRPMRAVRQASQLGFSIDEPTLRAIPATLASFRKVSAERIRDELLEILASPGPSRGLELLRGTGLLAEILPELLAGVGCVQNRHHKFDVWGHTLATLNAAVGDEVLRLGALLHDVGKPATRAAKEGAPGEFSFWKHEYLGAEMARGICDRLRLSNAQKEAVEGLVLHHMFFYSSDWSDGTIRRFVRRVGAERMPALLALREADVVGRGFGEDRRRETAELEGRLAAVATADAALTVKDLAIDGRDVMRALDIGPGRQIGVILEALLERVLDDPSLNTPERLTALAVSVARPGSGV
jgi:tRNA nucleotidyltransferase (CCA-adding enzyme)